ncbi:hypothetical protein C8R46DRAFT_1067884 [Mycena filopes]|nr:hypothetical protein C8R46DRAFT_1067884 [Mycena filopes]
MHPSLEFKVLASLPFSLRTTATRAYNGSGPALERILNLLWSQADEAELLLPVLFANLDDSTIPSATYMDTIWATDSDLRRTDLFHRPLQCLDQLLSATIPKGALCDLWPRAWAWCLFFFTYHSFLPEPEQPTLYGLSSLYVGLLHLFGSTRECSELLMSTPGVRTLFATAWKHLSYRFLDEPVTNLASSEVYDLCLFLKFDARHSSPAQLQEYIDGVDSDVGKLASLLELHIRTATIVLERSQDFSGDFKDFFSAPIAFLRHLEHSDSGSSKLLAGWPASWYTETLTRAARVLVNHAASLQSDCIDLLAGQIETPRGFRQIRCLLNNDFLTTLRASAMQLPGPDGGSESIIRYWLVEILPSITVFHSLLAPLQIGLQRALHQTLSTDISSPEIAKAWSDLVNMIEARAKVKAHFDSENYVPVAGCDNVVCGQIQDRTVFKQCSQCQTALYCSTECQRLDWKAGHRRACAEMRTLHRAHSEVLTRRDRAFLRALLDEEYAQRKPLAMLTCLTGLTSNLDSERADFGLLLFDLRRGVVQFVSRQKYQVTKHGPLDLAPYHRRRFHRSQGRVAHDLVLVKAGGATLSLTYLMHSSNTHVYDALLHTSRNVELLAGEEGLNTQLAHLVGIDVRTIH